MSEDFPEWFAKRMVECLERMTDPVPERGVPLTEEQDRRGEAEARCFAKTLELPADGSRCADLFPRLWSCHLFVEQCMLHSLAGRLEALPWTGVARREVLQRVLLGTWQPRGRDNWQASPDAPGWAG